MKRRSQSIGVKCSISGVFLYRLAGWRKLSCQLSSILHSFAILLDVKTMPNVSRPMLRWYTFELLGVVHFLIRIYLLMHFGAV